MAWLPLGSAGGVQLQLPEPSAGPHVALRPPTVTIMVAVGQASEPVIGSAGNLVRVPPGTFSSTDTGSATGYSQPSDSCVAGSLSSTSRVAVTTVRSALSSKKTLHV